MSKKENVKKIKKYIDEILNTKSSLTAKRPLKQDKLKKTSILAQELKHKINKNEDVHIIDVRSEKEFFGKMGHIDGSLLMPLQKIAGSIIELKKINDTIYVICLSGKRSAMAAQILRSNGMDAVNVKGGMLAWNSLD